MQSRPSTHKEVVQHEFTQQAQAYASNASVIDPDRLHQFVQAVRPPSEARVLDVATGPGYVAMAFAEVCREVIGIDLTNAPLTIAEATRQQRQLKNVRFQIGDAEHLPFTDGEFDIVTCRLALHHVEVPQQVLAEMTRVCRTQGIVAIEDLVVSEYPERAEYQNHFEHLRDLSHTRALPMSEFLALFTANGLEVENIYTGQFIQSVERWLANAHTSEDRAAEVWKLIEQDELHDLSGTHPFRQGGKLFFLQRTSAFIGRKLASIGSQGTLTKSKEH